MFPLLVTILIFLVGQIGCSLTRPLKVVVPNFIQHNESGIYMEEGRESGSFIASVLVEDNLTAVWNMSLDTDCFELRYSYANTWALYSAVSLDRELESIYNFSILAMPVKDSRFEFALYEYNIIIYILDLNDNEPMFWLSTQTLQVPVGVKPNVKLIQINASDADAGSNGQIVFSLDNYNDYFRIGHDNGLVISRRHLMKSARYDLIVRATDQGIPAKSSSIVLKIEVVEDRWSFYRINQISLVFGTSILLIFVVVTLTVVLIVKKRYTDLKLKKTLNLGFFPFSCDSNNDKCSIVNAYGTVANSPYTKGKCIYSQTIPCVHSDEFYKPKVSHCMSSNGISHCGHFGQRTAVRYFERPITAEIGSTQISNSDDGCYCSSDISSENSDRRKARQQGLSVVTSQERILDETQAKFTSNLNSSENSDQLSASFV